MAREFVWSVSVKGDISGPQESGPYSALRAVIIQTALPDLTADLAATESADVFSGEAVTVSPLLSPTLLTIADNGTFNVLDPVTFTWQNNLEDATLPNPQTSYCFERLRSDLAGFEFVSNADPTLDEARALAYSTDGSIMAVALDSAPWIRLYNTVDWSVIDAGISLPGRSQGMEFSPNGQWLAAAHSSGDNISVFNVADWTQVTVPAVGAQGLDCAFRSDSTMLAVASQSVSDQTFTVYDTSTWTKITNPVTTAGVIGYAIDWSAAGDYLCVGDGNRAIIISTPGTDGSAWAGEFVITVPGGLGIFDSGVRGISFSPTDNHVAVSGNGTASLNVSIVNYLTQTTVTEITAGTGCWRCRYSPDGTKLAICHVGDTGISVVDTTSWEPDFPVAGQPSVDPYCEDCKFSSDSQMLTIAMNTPTNEPAVTVTQLGDRTEYWNGTDWQLTPVYINSASEEVTFPAEAWRLGT